MVSFLFSLALVFLKAVCNHIYSISRTQNFCYYTCGNSQPQRYTLSGEETFSLWMLVLCFEPLFCLDTISCLYCICAWSRSFLSTASFTLPVGEFVIVSAHFLVCMLAFFLFLLVFFWACSSSIRNLSLCVTTLNLLAFLITCFFLHAMFYYFTTYWHDCNLVFVVSYVLLLFYGRMFFRVKQEHLMLCKGSVLSFRKVILCSLNTWVLLVNGWKTLFKERKLSLLLYMSYWRWKYQEQEKCDNHKCKRLWVSCFFSASNYVKFPLRKDIEKKLLKCLYTFFASFLLLLSRKRRDSLLLCFDGFVVLHLFLCCRVV